MSLYRATISKFMDVPFRGKLKSEFSTTSNSLQSGSFFSKLIPNKRLRERIDKAKLPSVAVLNLHGVIMAQQGGGFGAGKRPLNLGNTRKLIDEAFGTKKLEAVFLSVNSPGGSAVQSELIAEYIIAKGKDKSVPVYSFVEDVAASGGYWLACAGEKIFVSKSSVVGSIGVISASFGLHEAIGKLGIERRVLTAGTNKSFYDPFKPVHEKDVALIQNILDQIHINFKSYVKSRRGSKLVGAEEKLFNGEVWVGQQAVELGLADQVSSIDAAIRSEFGGENKVRQVFVKSPGFKIQEMFGANLGLANSAEELLFNRSQVLESALLYQNQHFMK